MWQEACEDVTGDSGTTRRSEVCPPALRSPPHAWTLFVGGKHGWGRSSEGPSMGVPAAFMREWGLFYTKAVGKSLTGERV